MNKKVYIVNGSEDGLIGIYTNIKRAYEASISWRWLNQQHWRDFNSRNAEKRLLQLKISMMLETLNKIAQDLFGKDYTELSNPQELKIVLSELVNQ